MAAPAHHGRNPRRNFIGDQLFTTLAPYISFVDHLRVRLVSTTVRFFCQRLGRPPPPFPWLMLPPLAATAGTRRSFYDIPGGRAYSYDIPGEGYYRCVASSAFGWLVLSAVDMPRRLALVNPITGQWVIVSWPFGNKRVDRFHATITSSPASRWCFLVVATDRLLAYCRPGTAHGWRTLRAPGFRYDATSSDITTFGVIVYLVDTRGELWRADLANPEPEVERRAMMVVPALSFEDRTILRLYLVKFPRLVHLVLTDEDYKKVELFRLDWGRRMWVPEDVHGDLMLLLGRGCSAAVPADGRFPGTALFAHQPSLGLSGVGGTHGDDGGDAWFWAESRVRARPDELLVRKKTIPHRRGKFTAGDSFWFFPAIDPDEDALNSLWPRRSFQPIAF